MLKYNSESQSYVTNVSCKIMKNVSISSRSSRKFNRLSKIISNKVKTCTKVNIKKIKAYSLQESHL